MITKMLCQLFPINRRGNMALYAILLIMVGLGLAIFVFFPEYLDMQNGIYDVSCNDIRIKIDSAVEDYNVNNSKTFIKIGGSVDQDTLKEKGYLREIKKCPQNGKFLFGKNGKVICTIHSKGN